MEPLFLLAEGEWWCVRCGTCREVDAAGYCRECSYMAAGREPDQLDQVIAQLEVARETAADAGLEEVYAAVVKAQLVLGYLGRELVASGPTFDHAAQPPRAS
jgi:hypothetical protein